MKVILLCNRLATDPSKWYDSKRTERVVLSSEDTNYRIRYYYVSILIIERYCVLRHPVQSNWRPTFWLVLYCRSEENIDNSFIHWIYLDVNRGILISAIPMKCKKYAKLSYNFLEYKVIYIYMYIKVRLNI